MTPAPLSLSGHLVRALWRLIGRLLTPAFLLVLLHRKRRSKEDPVRWRERMGIDATIRPEGRVLWVHAASVGESLSVLPLLEALRDDHPGWQIVLTTGTVTSARLLSGRLPPGVRHRYVPVDCPLAIDRFFDGWKPDAALFIEQEIWPGLLLELRCRMIPAALLNARFSPGSLRGWRRLAPLARLLFGAFDPILAQGATVADGLRSLGLPQVREAGNLKLAAPPLVVDEAVLAALRADLGERPVLVAASLQPDEGRQLAAMHDRLAVRWPDLLTVLVPRHPERLGEWLPALQALPRRSRGDAVPPGGIYIADTLGELGLWYRLAQVAFVGGSLMDYGGHNPSEAPRLGVPAVMGPSVYNCADLAEVLTGLGVLTVAPDADGVETALATRLAHPAPVEITTLGEGILSTYRSAVAPLLGSV